MNKKGELTTSQIVLIILSLAGFVVLLLVLYLNIDIFTSSADEVCRASVLTRATVSETAKGILPLKCDTKKICLTNGPDCKQFAGEKGVVKVKIDSSLDENKKGLAPNHIKALKVSRVLAESMYNCWDMMGEGKLTLFGSYAESRGWKAAKNVCVICSRVAVEDGLFIEIKDSEQFNLNDYISSNSPSKSTKTYKELFTDEGTSSFPNIQDTDYSEDKLEPNEDSFEMAFMFSQIRKGDFFDKAKNLFGDAALASAIVFYVAPGDILTKSKFVIGAAKPLAIIVGIGVATGAAKVTVSQIESSYAVAGYCGEFVSNEKNEEGCSLIQSVPYSASNINKLCDVIDGNP